MKFTKSTLIIVCLMLCACPIVEAQDGPIKGAKDAGKPSEQHKILEKLVGKWDVNVQFKISDKWNKGKSQCVSEMILGGRFLQQTYESKMFGEPFSVVQTFGYDNLAERFIETHMNNMTTGIDVRRGILSKDGMSVKFEGESTDPITKKKQRVRTVLTITDDNTFDIVWYQTIGESKEQKTVVLSHIRKKKE